MKRSIVIFILLSVLSIPVFADGDFPIGGKSCPNGQTSCLVAPIEPDTKTENSIFKNLTGFLKFIFG